MTLFVEVAGLIAFCWIAVAIPVALVLGAVIRHRDRQTPTPERLDVLGLDLEEPA